MTSNRTTRAVFFTICALLTLLASGFTQEQLLKDRFVGKTFVIRHFYSDLVLDYDPFGRILQTPRIGTWTVAQFRVEKVKIRPSDFELRGSRMALIYDQKKDVVVFSKLSDQEIKVKAPPAAITESTLNDLTGEIFVSLKQEPQAVPDYWRDLVSGNVESEKLENGTKIYRLKTTQGPSVPAAEGVRTQHPKPIKQPDPEFSPLARALHYQGSCLLRVVISDLGTVEDVRILRPLGLGLDELAVEKIKTWTFSPGTLDGKLVKALVNIEVTFHLFR